MGTPCPPQAGAGCAEAYIRLVAGRDRLVEVYEKAPSEGVAAALENLNQVIALWAARRESP